MGKILIDVDYCKILDVYNNETSKIVEDGDDKYIQIDTKNMLLVFEGLRDNGAIDKNFAAKLLSILLENEDDVSNNLITACLRRATSLMEGTDKKIMSAALSVWREIT